MQEEYSVQYHPAVLARAVTNFKFQISNFGFMWKIPKNGPRERNGRLPKELATTLEKV